MSTRLTDAHLVQKLQAATNSQDSIQTLSLWLLHHRAHHEKIVINWLKVLKKAKTAQRLVLFYVANDVIQNSKRKNISHFKESFASVMKEATELVRDGQVRASVGRVFKIWKERNVYDADFITELQNLLDDSKTTTNATPSIVSDFKYDELIEMLQSVAKQETDSNMKMAKLNLSKLNATNAEIVQKLKDRSHGQQFSIEFEESTKNLEELIKCLTKEVEDRKKLMTLLEKSKLYYDTQRGEAKHVAIAYKNFASRVKALQKKLPEVLSRFPEPSPIPSPCADAPSPTNSDLEAELDLPEDDRSPVPEKASTNTNSVVDDSLQTTTIAASTTTTKSVGGEPIPILSTFFNQDKQKMPSWLDAFSKGGTQISAENTKSDSSSLDSRLSNLLQNIPNLPSSLQGTLLNSGRSKNTSVSSTSKRGPTLESGHGKDEYSGQNTPVQDEEALASSGASSFFSRLAATPKTQHTQKDILKGLTSIIQSASSKDSSYSHGNKAQAPSWNMKEDEPLNKVSSFLNKITTKSSMLSSSPSSFQNSPVSTTASSNMTETVSSAVHSEIFPAAMSAAADIHENLSFIPTLVPSTPTLSSFNEFKAENEFEEYDPGCQNFDMEMDMDLASEDSNNALNSPNRSDSSGKTPDDEDDNVMSMVHSRQSTLITLVTDSSPVSEPVSDQIENISSVQNTYMPSASVSHDYCDEKWPPDEMNMTGEVGGYSSADTKPVDSSGFVTSAPDHLMPIEAHSNGRSQAYSSDWSHSKIETVQSYRSAGEQKWGNNDWSRFNVDQQFPPYNQQRQDHNVNSNNINTYQSYPVLKQQYPPPQYGQQNFRNERKPHYAGYERNSHRPRFQSFASRGRGWNNHPPHPY